MSYKRLIVLALIQLIVILVYFKTFKTHQISITQITTIFSNIEQNKSEGPGVNKYVFDGEDLKTTESMKIDKTFYCGEDMGASFSLLVIVISAVGNSEARLAIRETWGGYASVLGAPVLYLIGSTANTSLQNQILAEDEKYADLIQGQFIDDYFNLTLKTISLVKWVSERCSRVRYVFKVDDDMFVNMDRVLEFSQTHDLKRTLIGVLFKKGRPIRSKQNKWYIPYESFSGKVWPNFVAGPGYIFSGDSAQPLYEWSIKLKPIHLEDVYMTGIVAERAGIKRIKEKMMSNLYISNLTACKFTKIMTSHEHSPQDIRDTWDMISRVHHLGDPCPSTTTSPEPKSVNNSYLKLI